MALGESTTARRNFSPWAFTTGYSGVAHTLLEVFRVTGEEGLVRTIHEIVEAAIDDAQQVGEGYGWSTYHGIVGDAGTILTILEMAEAFEVARWRDFAVQATRAYFGRSRRDRLGNLVYKGSTRPTSARRTTTSTPTSRWARPGSRSFYSASMR